MADRIRSEIKSDGEVKRTNSAGDEMLEYAIQNAQDGFLYPHVPV